MRRFPRVSALCLAAGLTPVLLSLTLGSVPPGAQAAPPTPVTRESTLPAGFTMSASDLAPGASTASGIAPALPLISPYPDLGGWPVTFPGAAGPPVAADIDTAYAGLEVLFGTLSSGVNLYAVHADGTPVPGWPVDVGFFVAGSPAVADLDGDGSLDVAAGDFGSNSVWALRADGTPMPGWPIPVGANVRSTPAIADLDPAYPGLEVVVGVQDGTVQAWHADGTPVPGWPAHAGNFVERSSPAIADVNNDGSLEVFIGSWYDGMPGSTGGVYGFAADGSTLPGWPQLLATHTSVVASPAVADMDADGRLDIVVGTYETNARVFAWHDDGTLVSGWPTSVPRGVASGSNMTSSPAVGDLDGDGHLEVVTGSTGSCGVVYAWHSDGTVVSGWPDTTNAVVDGSSPVLGDVDGDGAVDVVVGTGSGFTPFGCTAGAISKAYAFHADGTLVTGWPVDLGTATIPGPGLWDVDGDGDTDILLAWAGEVFAWDAPAAFGSPAVQWPYFSFDVAHTGRYLPTILTDVAPPATPPSADLRVSPNPARCGTPLRVRYAPAGRDDAGISLTIVDARGRLVRRLAPAGDARGSHEALWNGRDESGAVAPPGVYFARLAGVGGTLRYAKLTLVR